MGFLMLVLLVGGVYLMFFKGRPFGGCSVPIVASQAGVSSADCNVGEVEPSDFDAEEYVLMMYNMELLGII